MDAVATNKRRGKANIKDGEFISHQYLTILTDLIFHLNRSYQFKRQFSVFQIRKQVCS